MKAFWSVFGNAAIKVMSWKLMFIQFDCNGLKTFCLSVRLYTLLIKFKLFGRGKKSENINANRKQFVSSLKFHQEMFFGWKKNQLPFNWIKLNIFFLLSFCNLRQTFLIQRDFRQYSLSDFNGNYYYHFLRVLSPNCSMWKYFGS